MRVANPVRQSWPAAGSESCVVVERSTLRSVDSECQGRVIEPRKLQCRSLRCGHSGGRVNALNGLVRWSCRGRRAGHRHKGFPRNVGGPVVSVSSGSGPGLPVPRKPQAPGSASGPARGTNTGARDGTAKRRKTKRGGKDDRASQRPDSTEEAGESCQGRPCGGKRGVRSWDRSRETQWRHRAPRLCQRDKNG